MKQAILMIDWLVFGYKLNTDWLVFKPQYHKNEDDVKTSLW